MSANGLHRIRWSRAAVARVHRTAARQFVRDFVNIQQGIAEEGGGKCRQTDSIRSDGDGLPWQESTGPPRDSSRETY